MQVKTQVTTRPKEPHMTQADSSTFSRTSKPRLRPFSPAVRPQAAPWLFWSEPCSKTSCPIGGENCKFHPPARFRLGQLQAGRRKVDFSHLSLHLPFPLCGLSAAAAGVSALGAADYRVRFCPPPRWGGAPAVSLAPLPSQVL